MWLPSRVSYTAAVTETLPTARLKRLQANVRRYMLDRAMVPPDGRILVAVSGGPDSAALLVLLARLGRSLNLALHVAHYDHGVRSRAVALREEAFVRRLAESYDLPVTVGHGDVGRMAKEQKLSLEDAARRQRYAFLAEAAAEAGCGAVATGHTASDQAETVIMHIVRGSGLSGLAGMGATAPWPFPSDHGLRLIRPLIRLSREDTLGVCEDAGLQPMQDESNASPRFRRNRVRNEVMPLLRQLNPRVEDALVRLADAATEDYGFILAEAEGLLRQPRGDAERLARAELRDAPSPLRRHVLRIAIGRAAGGLQDFGERHLAAIERLALEGKTGDRLDLPRGITAELRRNNLALLRHRNASKPELPATPLSVTAPGSGRFGAHYVAIAEAAIPGAICAEVDAGSVGNHVIVRKRRPGDRFQPLGMKQPKKLKDFFIDAHVPRADRDGILLFEAEPGVVWVGGLRIAEWARPLTGKPTLFLSYKPVSPLKE
jgi:tRNA(Ile)-lysidine synthase